MINATAARTRQTSRPSSVGSVASHNLLRQGASGAEVKQLQRALVAAGVKTAVSGRFDAGTAAAVREYQRAKGLQVDGVVGQQTWGSFVGKSYPPGSQLLAGGTSRQHSHPVGTPRQPSTVQGPTPSDSFEGGPGKRVAAYVNGQPRTISVVPAGNGQYLRADAAKAFSAMTGAARRAGINLGATSGFRTMAQQQSLFAQYGSPRAARPGYSNHQNGIAMDISGVGGRGTSADRWLLANASKFGFRNLPSEFWHYDFVG